MGDVEHLDIAGARAAGIDGVLIDRAGLAAPDEVAVGDLREIPRIAERGLAVSRWIRPS